MLRNRIWAGAAFAVLLGVGSVSVASPAAAQNDYGYGGDSGYGGYSGYGGDGRYGGYEDYGGDSGYGGYGGGGNGGYRGDDRWSEPDEASGCDSDACDRDACAGDERCDAARSSGYGDSHLGCDVDADDCDQLSDQRGRGDDRDYDDEDDD